MLDIDGNILNKILENQTQEHIKNVIIMLKVIPEMQRWFDKGK